MPSLKSLRIRINSVKATQKITSAMKMVAASKLRRAQERAEAARPYADRMDRMVRSLADSLAGNDSAPALLRGTGSDKVHLLVVATSDRGLCGAFNSAIVRAARRHIEELTKDGKTVKLFMVGRKGRDQLRRDHESIMVTHLENVGVGGLSFDAADDIAGQITRMFDGGEFDVCTLIYNHFKSAMSQQVTFHQLVPFNSADGGDAASTAGDPLVGAIYEFEPEEETILAELLPRNVGVQIFRGLLENNASEQGARMVAMDNATRNAGEMIDSLTLTYNRTRQAVITKELIEIISGAEAV